MSMMSIKVKWDTNIRSRYNQIPHPTQDTTWESDKNTGKRHTQESQEVTTRPQRTGKTV